MKTVLIMSLFTMFASCNKNFDRDDFLTVPKTPYTGSQLRLDGYYYQIWDNGTKFSNITFLYQNGVVLRVGESGNITELNKYAEQSRINNYRDAKGFWGLFTVDADSVVYERWVGTEGGYRVYREEGRIINDSTFVMTAVSRMKKGVRTDTKEIQETYYLKPFSPKPDSSNNFIK